MFDNSIFENPSETKKNTMRDRIGDFEKHE